MTEGGAPLALAMLMAGGAGGAVLAAPPAGAAPTISAQQLAEYYPALAQRKNVQGDVVLDCVVTAAGGLERCAVAAERPAGYGFGAASMQVAAHLHVGPTLADGSPSAGRSYRLPIRWTTPPAPARNSTPAAPATGAAATGAATTFGPDPASTPAPSLHVGDSWIYERTHEQAPAGFSRRRVEMTVERIASDTMVIGIRPEGAPTAFEDHVVGLDWSGRRLVDDRQTVTGRPFAFPLTVGETWKADYVEPRTIGRQTFAHFATTYRVVGWERVATPAGEFRALKVEGNGTIEARFAPAASAVSGTFATSGGATTFSHVEGAGGTVLHATSYAEFYYVPAINYFVRTLQEQYDSENVRTSRDTEALVSFKKGS